MLIQFNLENYLSFKEENTFSLETGERLRKFKEENTMELNGVSLLKSALIVGPNGAGKSNLLHGLMKMKEMLLNPTKRITDKLSYLPFLLSDDEDEPINFEIEFFYKDYFFKYNFGFVKNQFIKEVLEFKENYTANYEIYFERVGDSFEVCPENRLDLSEKTRANSLFLYNLQDQNDFLAIKVFEWFENVLYFYEGDQNLSERLELLENPSNKEVFLQFLHAADFNIIDIEIQKDIMKIPAKLKDLLGQIDNELVEFMDEERLVKRLRTVYKKYDSDGNVIGTTSLDLGLESSGTRQLIEIALAVIYCNETQRILVIDEFDDSLHLSLSKALMKVFNSKNNMNQFILTTHELQLLDTDLRIDQIYLVEKDFKGASEIYSLFDFEDDSSSKNRYDVKRFKQYLEGKFGAIPLIDVDGLTNINFD